MSGQYTTVTRRSNQSSPIMVKEIITVEDHDNFIAQNDKCVMFFGSQKCQHCRAMVPVIANLAKKYPGVKFSHVEITKTTVEGIDEGVPVFVGYKNHVAVDKVLGADQDGITHMIEGELLY